MAADKQTDFSTVTETPRSNASREQLRRLLTRYGFAAGLTGGGSVLEVACGAGQGLGLLAGQAQIVTGVDIDEGLVDIAKRQYADRSRITIVHGDAQQLPFD